MRVIYTKNNYHLGDCVYTLIMFKNINQYIVDNNICIVFYCEDQYYDQILDFNSSNNIIIKPLSECNNINNIIDLWIGSNNYSYNWFSYISGVTTYYDVFFCNFYNNILNKINIPIKLNNFYYSDNDLPIRCANINYNTNNKYSEIDFLINNGIPMSGQYDYDIIEWNNFIIELNKKYKVITTQKVSNILCTRDDNLNVKDIAAVAINAKNIIAIESGVVSGLYNSYIVNNPNINVYKLAKFEYLKCSFSNFHHIFKLSELKYLLQ